MQTNFGKTKAIIKNVKLSINMYEAAVTNPKNNLQTSQKDNQNRNDFTKEEIKTNSEKSSNKFSLSKS